MKKIFPAAAFTAAFFLFCSCQISSYTPHIDDFEQNALIAIGESEFECAVAYSGGCVSVTALTSNAAGFSARYDGESLIFTYGGMEYTLQNGGEVSENPAVFIYNVLYYVENSEKLTANLLDTGYKFEGEISLGSFVMYQGANGLPQAIKIEAAGISVRFNSNS